MGQEGSESTAVLNPSFLRTVVSGLSKIKNYALHHLHVISYTANPADHHSGDHGSKVDHQSPEPATEPDIESHGASLADQFKNSPTNPSKTPLPITHFPRPWSQNSTRSRSEELPEVHGSSEPQKPNQTCLSNPVAEAFREVELGKAFLTFVMPISAMLLSVADKDLSPELLHSTLCLICAAFVALFYGNSLRNMLPRIANVFEQFGTACIYTSFFLAVGSQLPPDLIWFPYICFIASILLSVYSCLPFKKK